MNPTLLEQAQKVRAFAYHKRCPGRMEMVRKEIDILIGMIKATNTEPEKKKPWYKRWGK